LPYFPRSSSSISALIADILEFASFCFCMSALMFCLNEPCFFFSFSALQTLISSSDWRLIFRYLAVGSLRLSRSRRSLSSSSSSLSESPPWQYCIIQDFLNSLSSSAFDGAAFAAPFAAGWPSSFAASAGLGPGCASAAWPSALGGGGGSKPSGKVRSGSEPLAAALSPSTLASAFASTPSCWLLPLAAASAMALGSSPRLSPPNWRGSSSLGLLTSKSSKGARTSYPSVFSMAQRIRSPLNCRASRAR